jgi:glycosyltransferase involved in cell wall biosynthesis
MTLTLSVIVPVYNRGELIRYTMESLRRASQGLQLETIVVDDGSTTSVADDLARLGFDRVRVIRQTNQGLLFARLTGLQAAIGRYTLFLDSDDLVAPEKLHAQVQAQDASRADVSYTDGARCELNGDYDAVKITADEPMRTAADAADFFINIQPAPHSPIFRTEYLREIVSRPYFPPSPLYNCVAEIWFYHNAAPRPARVVHVPGPLTITGVHPTARLTNHWERLAIASLAVIEAFARSVPATADNARVRRLVGEKAFCSWRRLPRNFCPIYEERLLAVWRLLAGSPADASALGGGSFQRVSALLGPEIAGKVFRRWQNRPYDTIRTMPDHEVRALLSALPPS